MEKLDKKKVLAVVLIIALIASLISIVSLLYNSIDMFLHNVSTSVSYNSGRTEHYIRWQEPYAIITLIAFLAAVLGTGVGIASFAVKKEPVKKLCSILALCAVGVLVILTVAAAGVNFANEAYRIKEVYEFEQVNYPYGVYGNTDFALYSGVMSAMLQQLVITAIIAVVLLIVRKIDKKAEIVVAENNYINLENKGE